jgi:hypothetical protein
MRLMNPMRLRRRAAGRSSLYADQTEGCHTYDCVCSNCYRVPAPRNGHSTFSKARNGSIRLVNDFGTNYENMVFSIGSRSS